MFFHLSRFSTRLTALLSLLLTGFATTALAAKPAAIEQTDQVIVHFDNPSASGELRALGLSRVINQRLTHLRRTSDGSNVYKLDQHQELAQVRGLTQALETVSGVDYAEPDQLMLPVLVEPNDQFYNSAQWHYQDGAGGINAPSAWATFATPATTPVYVAVLDTGYRPHVDLVANLVAGADMIGDAFVANDGDGRDMDPSDPGDWTLNGECGGGSQARDSSWHGTHVSGTIAAATNNSVGLAGVTYNMAKVVPVRVLGRCGGYLSDIADGIRWAVGYSITGLSDNTTPAQLINMSLGGSGNCSTTYQSAINDAVAAGTSVVVSAGNSNTDAATFQPANCNNVITVAATNIDGGRSYYSNYGAVVDIAAPGGEMNSDGTLGIASTLNDGSQTPGNDNYAYYQGTSMAAPHVAGIAALMLLKDPALTPAEIEAWLTITARDFASTCSGCGAGISDAGAAVIAVAGGTTLPTVPTLATLTSILDNQNGTATLFWSDSNTEQYYQIQRQKQNRRKWSGWGDIATAVADQISYTDSSGSGTFRYRIRATNSVGSSDWSISEDVTVTDSSSSDSGGKPNKPCRGKNC